MARTNLDVVRQLFDSFAGSGVDAALELIDETVIVEIPPEMSAEPDSYHGHAGVRRYFAGFDGMISDLRYEPLELIPVGDDVVLAHVRLSGRGASSGLGVSLEPYVVHRLRDGRIVHMRPYLDRASAEAALG
jgi:ketosteroid isomerase-like protein